MKTEHSDKPQLVVVYKKDVEPEEAERIFKQGRINYRNGMDSSKGKIYFYSTGPKYILTFESEQDKEKFVSQYKSLRQIREMYTADWTKHKD